MLLVLIVLSIWASGLGYHAEGSEKGTETLFPFGPALQPPVTFQIGEPMFMHSGDFDGDGKVDLLLLTLSADDYGKRPFSFSVVLLFGDGTGRFHSPSLLYMVEEVQREGELAWRGLGGFTVDDLDRDGYLDIAIVDSVHGGLWLLWGSQEGQFEKIFIDAGDSALSAVVSADLTATGCNDLAVLDPLGRLIHVFRRVQGSREFTHSEQFSLPEQYLPLSLRRGRFTTYASDDLLVLAYRMLVPAGEAQLAIFVISWSSGEPRLHHTIVVGEPAQVEPPAWDTGDYDADGHQDILVVRHGIVFALWGNGTGQFTMTDLYPVLDSVVLQLLLVDVDQDACPNLVLVGQETQRIWVSRGCYVDEHYLIPVTLRRPPRCVVVADFNGDNLPDLVVATSMKSDLTHLEVFLGRR